MLFDVLEVDEFHSGHHAEEMSMLENASMIHGPVLNRQAGHAREVARVVGDQHGARCHGVSGDHGVHAADQCSRLVQIGGDRCKGRGSRLVPRQTLNAE